MPWEDLDKPEEAEYEEHFSRRCVKHGRFYEGLCPEGNHHVKKWEVVNLWTGQALVLCRDNFGPVKWIRQKKITP